MLTGTKDSTESLPHHDISAATVISFNHKHRPQSRSDPRVSTVLMGSYRRADPSEQMPVVVEDLSRSGVGMLCFTPDQLASGDILQLRFGLDDSHGTVVKASVCVRWVEDAIFGAQFVDPKQLPQAFFNYLAAFS